MKILEIAKAMILSPFTVREFFEENFYVTVERINETGKAVKKLFPDDCGVYSFLDKENKKFCFEYEEDNMDKGLKYFTQENVSYVIMNVRYNEGCQSVCEGALEKNTGKILLSAYIYKVFKKIIEEYQAYPVCFVMHKNEGGNDEDVFTHFHLCFSVNEENEGRIESDFSAFIESAEDETEVSEEAEGTKEEENDD